MSKAILADFLSSSHFRKWCPELLLLAFPSLYEPSTGYKGSQIPFPFLDISLTLGTKCSLRFIASPSASKAS